MKFQQGEIGRIFTVKLEDGDEIPTAIEEFAKRMNLLRAVVFFLGGAADDSKVIVGPDKSFQDTIVPIVYALKGPSEIFGVGTLFPDENGDPVLHMHVVSGREGGATIGCSRAGVKVWLTGEVVIIEIKGIEGVRIKDAESGLKLFEIKD